QLQGAPPALPNALHVQRCIAVPVQPPACLWCWLYHSSLAPGLPIALSGLGGLSCLLNLNALAALGWRGVLGPGSEAAGCVAAWLLHGSCGGLRGATTGHYIMPCTGRARCWLQAGRSRRYSTCPAGGFQVAGLVALSLFSCSSQGCWPFTAELTRVVLACAVSNSTAPADLVEREVVAVLQDLPGTTFNTLLATLAKSSSGHKISHAELSQALDNLSRRGFVIKDNRGNVKLSKSALTFSPISPPAPNTAAEDAVARQANSPETCDEAATAEELQQEILNILEGAPGMTASSLHAQLTKAMRGISLHRDEFMSLLEALSIAGMVIQDKRGNIRLAPRGGWDLHKLAAGRAQETIQASTASVICMAGCKGVCLVTSVPLIPLLPPPASRPDVD
ncbi:hypothetical protein HaLaN_14824, partial [Haematococcus lacustris]